VNAQKRILKNKYTNSKIFFQIIIEKDEWASKLSTLKKTSITNLKTINLLKRYSKEIIVNGTSANPIYKSS